VAKRCAICVRSQGALPEANIVLMPRTGPRPLVALGMLLAAAWLTRIGVHSSYATAILPAVLLTGAGLVTGPRLLVHAL
jgi:hypothetical protein